MKIFCSPLYIMLDMKLSDDTLCFSVHPQYSTRVFFILVDGTSTDIRDEDRQQRIIIQHSCCLLSLYLSFDLQSSDFTSISLLSATLGLPSNPSNYHHLSWNKNWEDRKRSRTPPPPQNRMTVIKIALFSSFIRLFFFSNIIQDND